MPIRGIRGATTVEANTREQIITRTKELLELLVARNGIEVEDIASAVFSVTEDLNAEFPAIAARKLGWIYTPLFCTREIPVPNSLGKCIRILLHVNSEKKQDEMIHLYLHDATNLRPDLDHHEKDRYYKSI